MTPRSTYRLQLGPDTTLDQAAEQVPYLHALGVSHLYLSPVLQARPGSTHGYDVVDHDRVSDALGGQQAWDRLVAATRRAGMELVIDIVPNHVGVAPPQANPRWWDVLANGPGSPYATFFDIDWAQGRLLLLPVLDDEEADLADLVIDSDPDGSPVLEWRGLRFPVAEGTLSGRSGGSDGSDSPREVHRRQWYRLVSWRRATTDLTYRRFFDVTDLAGIRTEVPAVFDATHARVLGWVADGSVAGLRIDHVDGLLDPRGYLARLRDRAGGAWVVVEKILEADEELPRWACDGTTGYEHLRAVGGLFVDPSAREPLTTLAAEVTGRHEEWPDVMRSGRELVARTVLGSEVARLAALVPGVPQAQEAILALLTLLPRYRTYLPGADAAEDDAYREVLAATATAVRRRHPGPDSDQDSDPDSGPGSDLGSALAELFPRLCDPADPLCRRFQQTSGMVMAKGCEDTAFYRYARFVALNEVGGDPDRFGVTPAEFHARAARTQASWPSTMTTLSTHDTKRSEDVRARLAVLAEVVDLWAAFVRRWFARLPPPDPSLCYLMAQTIVGAWPLSTQRAVQYLRKAAREGKERTSWTEPELDFERAMEAWVAAAVEDGGFAAEVAAFAKPLVRYGWSNALGQKLLQITMPGVPDVYQGTELWDLSLADPDNRREVDWQRRRALLERLDSGWSPGPYDPSGATKLLVVSRALRLRRERPEAFTSYRPLAGAGDAAEHLVGMDRGAVVALATRLPWGLRHGGGWRNTLVELPAGDWQCALTARTARWSGTVRVREVLGELPVALLVREDGG
jgi:(1->4)-alpha-D-glucan 1-alpha-D-glucosylmutase